jgi:hypothetical protein
MSGVFIPEVSTMLWFHCSIIDVMCFKDEYPRSSCHTGTKPAYAHLH